MPISPASSAPCWIRSSTNGRCSGNTTNHPRDVARRGEDPGVHFLRHWDHPFRKPSEAFDIAQYVLDHPEVLVERVNDTAHLEDLP